MAKKKIEDSEKVQSVLESMSRNTLEKREPEEGLKGQKIQVTEIGHIPSLCEHWEHELKRRRQMILDHKPKTLMRKFSKLIGKGNIDPEVSGEELLQWHPSTEARKLVEEIKEKPQAPLTRQQLVSVIGKSQRDFPLEFYRSLYLQATVSCMLGELSLTGLQINLFTQSLYLSKLFHESQMQTKRIQALIEKLGGQKKYSAQRKRLMRVVDSLRTNMKIIKKLQEQTSKATNTKIANLHCVIQEENLTTLLLDAGTANPDLKAQKDFLKQACIVLPMLRYLPLMREVGHHWADSVIKLSPQGVPYFLKGRMLLGQLVFEVDQYEAGARTSEVQKSIQETFKTAYHCYGVAIKKIAGRVETDTEVTIHIEYANLVHYFYKTTVHLLQIRVPSEWLRVALPKANRALMQAMASEKIGYEESIRELQVKISKDMAKAGIIEL